MGSARGRPKLSSPDRSTSTVFLPISRSSWMATVAGRPSVTCLVSRGTGQASTRFATSSSSQRVSESEVLTLYAFSVENWKRPAAEVSLLMRLLKRYLRLELATLVRQQHSLQCDRPGCTELSPDIRARADGRAAEDSGEHRNAVQYRTQLRGPRRNRGRRSAGDRGRPEPRRSR